MHMLRELFSSFHGQAQSAVSMFFFISGFLSYLSVQRTSHIKTFSMRWILCIIKKFVPLMIIVYTLDLTIFACAPLGSRSDMKHTNRLLTHTWLVTYSTDARSLKEYMPDPALYFVSVLSFYWIFLAFPLATSLRLLSDSISLFVGFASLVLPAISYWFTPATVARNFNHVYILSPITHMASFVCGTCLGRIRISSRRFPKLLYSSSPINGLFLDFGCLIFCYFQAFILARSWTLNKQSIRFQLIIPAFAVLAFLITGDTERRALITKCSSSRFFKSVCPESTLLLVYLLHTPIMKLLTWPIPSFAKDYTFAALPCTLLFANSANVLFQKLIPSVVSRLILLVQSRELPF
eukprot:Gregarina_sp_Poly_1__1253@NODE_1303_length_4431_cov_1311_404675_g882_i0_p2_GENE_NODE_1303_length_4431_cov_1311_404675_g882_i0NODE_1303_length_4431_cov_1311_404675_g882_i0_p2_ORF_typecomplete_len350_score3_65Acyl_transf_3/PF01757_22/8_3e11_NODE_1303_length_4431_cov_1311_404675_g882_i07351784